MSVYKKTKMRRVQDVYLWDDLDLEHDSHGYFTI